MSKIEWTDKTWNPVTGCTKISSGCKNCYAERMSKRLRGRAGYPTDDPFRVTLHPDRLYQPSTWRKPRHIFVCSMGDLFHEEIPGKFINDIWLQIINNKRHIFQILTKRPERMLEWTRMAARGKCWPIGDIWPKNAWLGVTAENQEMADKRIPILLQIPAAVRFVSVEPLLGPVDLTMLVKKTCDCVDYNFCPACSNSGYLNGLDWCIVGGENAVKARPMKEQWVRELIEQCNRTNTPVFYKQRMEGRKKITMPIIDGKQYAEFPRITGKQNEY